MIDVEWEEELAVGLSRAARLETVLFGAAANQI